MLLPLRHPRTWLILGWVFIVLAIVASLMPARRLPSVGVGDKVEHMAGYALLALWFAGIYPRSRYGVIALALFVMGVCIEWAQSAMHWGRQGDPRDVVANCIGIAAGLTLSFLWLGGWAQRIESWTQRVEGWTRKL
jgi:VanZ family protein